MKPVPAGFLILNRRIFDQADQCRRHIFARDLTIRNRQIGMNPTGTGFIGQRTRSQDHLKPVPVGFMPIWRFRMVRSRAKMWRRHWSA